MKLLKKVEESATFADLNNEKVENLKKVLERHPDVFADLVKTLQQEADSAEVQNEDDGEAEEVEQEVVIEVKFYFGNIIFNDII